MDGVFSVGDRVRITNVIRRPLGPPVRDSDYVGTVTRVTAHRLRIFTDNRQEIYRAPQNVKHENAARSQ